MDRYRVKSYLIDGGLKYGVEVGDIAYEFPLVQEMVKATDVAELAEEALEVIFKAATVEEQDRIIAKLEKLRGS